MHKDYGMVVCEEMIQEFNPIAPVAVGAATGTASGYLAKDRNKKNLAKLQASKAACGNNPACAQRYDAMIAKYKTKIANSKDSTIKRTIGGGVTTSIGALAYHGYDANKKRRQMKGMRQKLSVQLKQCPDDACKKKVQAQLAAMKGKSE